MYIYILIYSFILFTPICLYGYITVYEAMVTTFCLCLMYIHTNLNYKMSTWLRRRIRAQWNSFINRCISLSNSDWMRLLWLATNDKANAFISSCQKKCYWHDFAVAVGSPNFTLRRTTTQDICQEYVNRQKNDIKKRQQERQRQYIWSNPQCSYITIINKFPWNHI